MAGAMLLLIFNAICCERKFSLSLLSSSHRHARCATSGSDQSPSRLAGPLMTFALAEQLPGQLEPIR